MGIDTHKTDIRFLTDTNLKLMHISDKFNKPIQLGDIGFYIQFRKDTLFEHVKIKTKIFYIDNLLCIDEQQLDNGIAVDSVELLGFKIITDLETDLDFIRSWLRGNGYTYSFKLTD